MPRRYTEVETVLAADVVPGDEVVFRHTVVTVTRTLDRVLLVWEDGTETEYVLEGAPAIEVVARKTPA